MATKTELLDLLKNNILEVTYHDDARATETEQRTTDATLNWTYIPEEALTKPKNKQDYTRIVEFTNNLPPEQFVGIGFWDLKEKLWRVMPAFHIKEYKIVQL